MTTQKRQDQHGNDVYESNNIVDTPIELPDQIPDSVIDAAIEKSLARTRSFATKSTPPWDTQGYIVTNK